MTYAKSLPASERRTLPDAFVRALSVNKLFDGLADTLACTAPEVSVRVNTLKGVRRPASADIVPWCADGMYLAERPAFTLCPELHQGLFYVQDASSMIMQKIAVDLCGGRPVRWLDACAAPGGKTTAVLSALPKGSLVVANEFDRHRADALVENVQRWGADNCIVTTGDTAAYGALRGFFDIVSVDAPCSGEGMMRKEAVAVSQWSPGLVESCAALQREIIENVWPALRPGGTLVYSTCTFNTVEDEEVMQWMTDTFGAEPVDLGIAGHDGIAGAAVGTMPVARFLPSRLRGEGLFVCAVRKPGDSPAANGRKGKLVKTPKALYPAGWLNGDYVPYGDGLQAVPAALTQQFATVAAALPARAVLAAGVTVGVPKGRGVIPAYQLAQNIAINPGAYATAYVDLRTARQILHGDTMTLPDGTPRGVLLLTYNGRPLAFANNLGSRANNLVPDNRRILRNIPT